MDFLVALWLPILLSAVAGFLVSSVFHMAVNLHKNYTKGLSNEVEVADALRGGGGNPGEYLIPFCGDMKEMGTPEFKAKLKRGPVLFMTVMPNGPWKFGQSLVQWFVHSIFLGVLVAYVGHLTLQGADKITVFQVLGLVYGLATGAIFAWLWPAM